MSYQTEEHRACDECGDRYAASVEYRPDDQPQVVRSDEWLDGRLYCPVCLQRLEDDR